ncbi:MAG: hypothetical protein M1344_02590 [Candidatus Thermoplasmatota archaeon]|jgi:hypothetical protein|nr:hypothetical protein [Candidatus Thermoplasmatota archaeon]
MVQKWITKKSGDESRHVKIETERKPREVQVKSVGPTPAQLEKQAWDMLGDLSKITSVDQLLLQMKKYSGTLGDYSAFNSMLIHMQDEGATIVRSANEWKYFGRELKEDARPVSILYPVGIPRKDGPGKVKDFIERKREEGLDDEAIYQLVREKFNLGRTGRKETADRVVSQRRHGGGKSSALTHTIREDQRKERVQERIKNKEIEYANPLIDNGKKRWGCG